MVEILRVQDFYTQEGQYMDDLDPAWVDNGWDNQAEEEMTRFKALLGPADGRSGLDCSCGTGRQAIPLARLGWKMTATDITEASLEKARRRASTDACSINFLATDIRCLRQHFEPCFDMVISCMALDNIDDDAGIQEAFVSMAGVLKPGGQLYIRLRNFDQIMEDRPRYEFKEIRAVPFGQVIRLEDWEYESEEFVVHIDVFLREDTRHPEYWDTTTFAYRRRALLKGDLEALINSVGLQDITFIPQPNRWYPYEVIATKPAG